MTQTRGPYSEQKSPKVSVGLPVYNGERFLRQTLDSILGQTWTDFELIISDNASTDKTRSICVEYASRDSRIRYVRVEKLVPAPDNFNRVLVLALGIYFIWVAADDYWDSRYLEELVRILDYDPAIVGVNGEISFIDKNDQPVRTTVRNQAWEQESIRCRLKSLAFFHHGINLYFYSLYRTKELQPIGVLCYSHYPFKSRFLEFPTLFGIAAKGKVQFNQHARLYYRMHSDQDSHKHESIFMALYLEGRLVASVFPYVRKGGGSWIDTIFTLIVVFYVRGRAIMSFGIQKIKQVIRFYSKGSTGG